ncbi:MAG: 5-demethoxyubiquinol-8 5-hydroxylase UbiM [Thiomonas sp.]|uniref:5-demethoxyubiquinol-8 5-hydroxylase UbiM n=1 Tax=Thiomonas sp. TaxID=2047785 RepID=UPI002A35B11B|nr:5-demethoxyubiquinol-8 5-hydroxylase UbiM [Thiomonas sp.]MDY0330624.1 5-demethoxyubiquinol-8 5-hydroxylase UbiM [Thiomonas sp.]
MTFDLAIIGAGPSGLSMARALADSGLRIALVEQQIAQALADPPFDGREIALSLRTLRALRESGVFDHIPPNQVFPLEQAVVFNGDDPRPMRVSPLRGKTQLGALVPNHHIRRAVWAAVQGQRGLTLFDGNRVGALHPDASGVDIELLPVANAAPSPGETTAAASPAPLSIRARLLIAADSRFSETRRKMGIGADTHDFGKVMLVCRMQHEQPHHHTAWEWFGFGQTVALLPLSEHLSSVVLTLPQHEMDALLALGDADFERDIARRYQGRLGEMKRAGSRHTYALVGVYAQRFVAPRFALIGDAAVGMHPVTAHGFNFGLHGVELLSREILAAARAGGDIAAPERLRRYEAAHRRATLPLYLATQAIATLYTDDRSPARLVRQLVLGASSRFGPLRLAIATALSEEGLSLRGLLPRMA